MFSQLVYASRMIPGLKLQGLTEILAVAREANARAGITGMLCFGGDSFLQCLEGPRPLVTATYDAIARDPRHSSLELLAVVDAEVRGFDGWSMGWTRTQAGEPILRKYFTDGRFVASALRGATALAFLRDVASRSNTAGRDVPTAEASPLFEDL